MKKVVDWTFGSIFRTFGRIIAYLIFGIAISYILHSLDFRITDLFLDKVKADELYKGSYYMGHISGWRTNFSNYSVSGLNQAFAYDGYFTYPNTFNEKNVSKVTLDGFFYNLQGVGGVNEITCNDNSLGYCTKWNINSNYTISFKLWLTDEAYPCQINFDTVPNSTNAEYIWWTATCPYDLDFNRVKYHIYVYGTNSGGIDLGINENIHYYVTEGQSIIDNQNQNTQQIIEQQQNNTQQIIEQQQNATEQMLDSNTTQAESDIEGFFGDFDVPDVGGLSGIITAPLNTIRSLLSSSCTALVLPLPYVDEDLTLPCMNSIYTEHFGLFFSLYQTIILAIVAYRCIRSIYFDITGFTNPDDDRIEVMDL